MLELPLCMVACALADRFLPLGVLLILAGVIFVIALLRIHGSRRKDNNV